MPSIPSIKVLRLALLICDTPAPNVVEKHGDYPYLFRRIFRRALNAFPEDISLEIDITDFDVVHKQEYPTDEDFAAEKYDGVIISGSSFSAYEDQPWIKRLIKYVQDLHEKHPGIRILGICFGHQIVAMAFGGTCEKNNSGWEFGIVNNRLTESGKNVFGTDKAVMILQGIHQDHVPTVPPNFDLLATTSPHTPVQSLISHDHMILTVQGHPEFTAGFVESVLDLRLERGILKKEFAENARKTLLVENVDDVWITQRFIKFLQGHLEFYNV